MNKLNSRLLSLGIITSSVISMLLPNAVSAASLRTLQNQVTDIQLKLNTLQSSTTELQVTVSNLSSSITAVKSDVGSLQGSIGTFQNNIGTLNNSISTYDNSLLKLQSRITNLENSNSDTDILATRITALEVKATGTDGSIGLLSDRVKAIEDKVSQLSKISMPLVKDANNQVIGGLFAVKDSNFNSYAVFDPTSNAIYQIDPVTGKLVDDGPNVAFTGINCTGEVYALASRINTVYDGKSTNRYFISNTYTESTYLSKSIFINGACFNENNGNGSSRTGWAAKEVFPSFSIPVLGPLKISS